MLRQNLNENALDADCAECFDLRESYVEECLLLEEVEAISAEGKLHEVRDQVSVSRQAWHSAVRKTMRKPNHTPDDIKAKAPVIKALLQDVCDDNMEAIAITLTFIDDVERILGDNA